MQTVVADLRFGESPRWHDSALWFSDMHDHRVMRATLDGDVKVVAELPGDRPSGIGWLPDGRLLFVAMEAGKVMRLDADGAVCVHADLSPLVRGSANDMVVGADGAAYVGDMGGRLFRDGPVEWQDGQTIQVEPDGTVSCAADGLLAPNGHALSEDGRTLVVAESRASRIGTYRVDDEGKLSGRRVLAEIEPVHGQEMAPPDGLCLDEQGAVWVAELTGRRLIRILDGGEITDTITFEEGVPVACVLGGDDRRTLFACVAGGFTHHDVEKVRTGRIIATSVDVPGAGRP
jgi:sugar lactone lactonase YvrE